MGKMYYTSVNGPPEQRLQNFVKTQTTSNKKSGMNEYESERLYKEIECILSHRQTIKFIHLLKSLHIKSENNVAYY